MVSLWLRLPHYSWTTGDLTTTFLLILLRPIIHWLLLLVLHSLLLLFLSCTYICFLTVQLIIYSALISISQHSSYPWTSLFCFPSVLLILCLLQIFCSHSSHYLFHNLSLPYTSSLRHFSSTLLLTSISVQFFSYSIPLLTFAVPTYSLPRAFSHYLYAQAFVYSFEVVCWLFPHPTVFKTGVYNTAIVDSIEFWRWA